MKAYNRDKSKDCRTKTYPSHNFLLQQNKKKHNITECSKPEVTNSSFFPNSRLADITWLPI